MLPAFAILENFCFSAVSGIHFSSGKSLDWIVCGIEPNIYCLEKIARNTEGRPEKARNIHLEISSKFFKFRNVLLNISETSQYHKNYPDICRKVYVILRLVVILICFAAWIFFLFVITEKISRATFYLLSLAFTSYWWTCGFLIEQQAAPVFYWQIQTIN